MKKIRMYQGGINELGVYLNICEFKIEELKETSRIFYELLIYNITQIRHALQTAALKMIQRNTKNVLVKFTRGEILTFSYLFGSIPCDNYLAGIQYTLLTGLIL